MHGRKLIWVALLLITTIAGAESVDMLLRAGGLTTAGPPILIGNEILLSYEFARDNREGSDQRGAVHAVQAAFSHEQFGTLHTFKRNQNGIYVLSIPKARDTNEITYRIVVDGIWTTDPVNPDSIADAWGVRVSRYVIPAVPARTAESPIIYGDGTVEFALMAKSGQTVTIVGSFNGWDPYMTQMEELPSGVYKRRLRLPPGEHFYYFMVNGLRLADPMNKHRGLHGNGLVISFVELP